MEPELKIRVYLDGHVDDLYTLSLIFPESRSPDHFVVTEILGIKDRALDRVSDPSNMSTYASGPAWLRILRQPSPEATLWAARAVLAPLNGYAVLADSNYRPVWPVSAAYEVHGAAGEVIFPQPQLKTPRRLITVDRHQGLRDARDARVALMSSDPLAQRASATIGAAPNWADYYRLLEDIAGDLSTALDKLDGIGLARREALKAFKQAANNDPLGRHGASKRSRNIDTKSLMTLLEAREFMRGVVTRWMDQKCGNKMPTDRVDGGALRFGLDDNDPD